jgi:riboflavin synthase
MFTGIVEGLGTIKSLVPQGGGLRMGVQAEFPIEQLKIGDSVAVSGACLTVVVFKNQILEVDVAPETLSKTILGQAKVGDRVNLEQALRFGDRLGGHLVSGHIDGVGVIRSKHPVANATIFAFEVSEVLSRYIVEKGSIAIDGISLTVNGCGPNSFDVSIIPHTAKWTTIGLKNVGDQVNIETDMIGKYVERFTQPFAQGETRKDDRSSVSKAMLAEKGFM